jgi:phosphonate transport system substrate-binding protein
MSYQFTVSPDFTPDRISGWFIFNTWMQRQIGEGIHLEMYDSFDKQRAAIASDKIDLIYANPYDASMLVREKGFLPVARPRGRSDEAIIAVRADAKAQRVDDLQPGARLVYTDDPDVHMMGMIMLEAADLHGGNTEPSTCDTYVVVAKRLLRAEADVGIFLAEAFDGLSSLIRRDLRILVRSQISVVQHMLLVGPRFSHRQEAMTSALLAMQNNPRAQAINQELGFAGWDAVAEEDVEFMIDLIETLDFRPEG